MKPLFQAKVHNAPKLLTYGPRITARKPAICTPPLFCPDPTAPRLNCCLSYDSRPLKHSSSETQAERARERKRKRDTHTHTNRERNTQSHRQIEKYTQRERHTDRDTHTQTTRERHTQREEHTEPQTERNTLRDTESDTPTERDTHTQTRERYTHRQRERKRHRQKRAIGREREREKESVEDSNVLSVHPRHQRPHMNKGERNLKVSGVSYSAPAVLLSYSRASV